MGGGGAVSYIRNKYLRRDSDLLFFFSSLATAAINTRRENERERRVALKKHVWIQGCGELAAESMKILQLGANIKSSEGEFSFEM